MSIEKNFLKIQFGFRNTKGVSKTLQNLSSIYRKLDEGSFSTWRNFS